MHVRNLLSAFSLVLSSIISFAQPSKGRVMGYLDAGRNDASTVLNTMDWNTLTDLIYGFVQPDANGNLSDPYGLLSSAVSKAKAKGVHVHISSGGGAFGTGVFQTISSNASLRSNFATNVANYLSVNKLDGFDLDWEFPSGYTSQHVLLLQELRAKFDAKEQVDGKHYELAIAVGGQTPNQGIVQGAYHTDYISSNAFQYIDVLNLMTYDNFNAFPEHSTITMAQKVVEAYAAMGCPKSKMSLGVPFYGWTADRWAFKTYAELAATDLNNAYNKSQVTVGGATYYHNGKNYLEPKIDYIMQQGGVGVFSWCLNFDRFDDFSLMKLMTNYIKKYRQKCPMPNLGPNKTLCTGSPIVLDCGIDVGEGRAIEWTKPDFGKVSNFRTLSVSTPGTYKVRIDSGGVCADSQTVLISATMPAVNIGKDTSLCNPSTLTISSSVKDPKYNYSWQKDGNILPFNEYSIVVSQPGTYRLGISTNNCAEQFDEMVVSSSLPIVEEQTICTNTSATFTVLSAGSSFSWYADSTSVNALETGNSFTTPNLNQTTKYYVASNASGTSSTCLGVSDWSSIATYERATTSQVITVKYNGYLYTLNPVVWWSYGHNPEISTYYWKKGAACAVVCARTPVVANVSVCTGFDENKISEAITVFPNPFMHNIEVQFRNGAENCKISLTASDGTMIETLVEQISSGHYVINTSELSRGLYFLRIEREGKILFRKVSK
ncbi:MAG TPA: hypothetical protein DCR46_05925 [Cytophagales bacterium]|nr:hypothetical protein [Cytophagales bacterium]